MSMAATDTGPQVTDLTLNVVKNLRDQHDWSDLQFPVTSAHHRLIRGLPPKRLYTHPDDQILALEHHHKTGERLFQDAVYEWVLAVHLAEKWTLKDFSAIFQSIESIEPVTTREKRIVLATVHNDSTVVYYLMHQGMVKPRQN